MAPWLQPSAASASLPVVTAIHRRSFVQFQFRHVIDAQIASLERALMAPELSTLLGEALDAIDSVSAKSHEQRDDDWRRVWHFQAKAPLAILKAYPVTRDMMTWEEHLHYRPSERRGAWHVVPRPGIDEDAAWRRRFAASGSYRLESIDEERTCRTVSGDISIDLKLIGPLVERLAVAELRKAYAAEAGALRQLSDSRLGETELDTQPT
jgi:hypothetical protein